MKSNLTVALAIGLISVGITPAATNAQHSQSLEDRVTRLEKAMNDLGALKAPPSTTSSDAPPSTMAPAGNMAPPSSTSIGVAPPSTMAPASSMAPPSSYSAKKFSLKLSSVDDKVKITTWPQSDATKVSTVYEGSSPVNLELAPFVSNADENWVVRVELYNVAGPSGVTFQLVTDGQAGEAVSRSCNSWNVGWCVDYQMSLNRVSGAIGIVKDVTR